MAEPVVKVEWDDSYDVMRVDVIGSGMPPIVHDTRLYSGLMRKRTTAYGGEVRVTRAAAKGRDSKSGKSATPREKYDAVKRMSDHMTSGTDNWNATREAGRIGLDESILSRAMALAFPARTAEEIRAKVVGATPVQRIEMRNDPRVAPHYETLVKELARETKAESVLSDW